MTDRFENIPDEMIAIALIDRPERPAREESYDADVEELADDIAAHGLINSVILRAKPDGRYEIVAGDKRSAAHVLLGRAHIRAKVIDVSAEEGEIIKGQENFRRTDMTPMEEARFFHHYMQEYKKTAEQTAHTFQRSAVHIKQVTRLLDLPEEMQEALARGDINKGQGLEIALEQTEIGRNFLFDQALRGVRVSDLRAWRQSSNRTGLSHTWQQQMEEIRETKPQDNPSQGVKCVCCREWVEYQHLEYLHVCNTCSGFTKMVWDQERKLQQQSGEGH
jgi:ParB/RepB/Spo0J family partition protein